MTFRSDILKKDIKINVANAALRTVDFKGGLDKFLKTAKRKNEDEIIKYHQPGKVMPIYSSNLTVFK